MTLSETTTQSTTPVIDHGRLDSKSNNSDREQVMRCAKVVKLPLDKIKTSPSLSSRQLVMTKLQTNK